MKDSVFGDRGECSVPFPPSLSPSFRLFISSLPPRKAFFDPFLGPPWAAATQQNYLDVQREVVWALGNLTSGGSLDQLGELLVAGGVAALTSVLAVSEIGIVREALNALQNILKVSHLPHVVVEKW